RPADQANRQGEFLLLFDSRTRQMVSDDGVLVVNTPQKGKVGGSEGVSALYIGEGWWKPFPDGKREPGSSGLYHNNRKRHRCAYVSSVQSGTLRLLACKAGRFAHG